ncbi:MAG: endolytic transglycosylase MltG [Thermodesulfobacteriota bacterium]|nr:endolytic transglycosylase MltG [Thermodesulfobacteriota bacterium]
MKRPVSCGLIILICALVPAVTHVYMFISTAKAPESTTKIVIPRGCSTWEISDKLFLGNIITDPYIFFVMTFACGKARGLKAGTYMFKDRLYPKEIMNILFNGKTMQYAVTIPEGSDIYDIARILEDHDLCERETFIALAKASDTVRLFGLDAPSMEGFLYPDTYFFFVDMTPLGIMEKMVSRFHSIYTEGMARKASATGLSDLEAVTLASIIEKEAVRSEERPIISSVFHNRLRSSMRLQSDPTVIYGIETFHGKIQHKDILRKSPYNTYLRKGLPPGPICNPGKDSILAAVNPVETRYLYFVARGNGYHTFSSTLKAHNRAVRQMNH